MQRLVVCLLTAAALPSFGYADEPTTEHVVDTGWVRVQLDDRFRSEGVAVLDADGDGNPDIAAGDLLYVAPDVSSADHRNAEAWRRAEIRPPGEFVAGQGYSNSFANFAWDMDSDGRQDLVIIGFPGDPFHWYRNPGSTDGHWKEFQIWTSICNESPEFEDLNRDGRPEFVFGSQPQAQMGYAMIPPPKAVTAPHRFVAVGEPSPQDPSSNRRGTDNGTFKYYHGLGVDDVNGDGHEDILICHGWWENPGSVESDALWTFHPIRVAGESGPEPLPPAANLYADDFDGDGDNDLFLSSAHQYGVWWAENTGEEIWRLHEIDSTYSQTHAVERADMNGDGRMDYVTGKRFFAHNGRDPGGMETVVMHWYEVRPGPNGPTFVSHEIEAGRDTGIGTQFTLADLNKDGKTDIALSNKKGVNILLQK